MISSINELNSRVTNCAGCGTIARAFLCTGDGNDNFIPKNSVLLHEKINLDQCDLQQKFNDEIVYTSYYENNFLHFCWFYGLKNMDPTRKIHSIFKINIHTNEIIGDFEHVQNLFWTKKLSMYHVCCNDLCEDAYMAETETLVFERKSKRLYPFELVLEGYGHKEKDAIYFLFNSQEKRFKSNTILMKYNETLTKGTIITKLPTMNFTNIKSDIDKKIKTILTFL